MGPGGRESRSPAFTVSLARPACRQSSECLGLIVDCARNRALAVPEKNHADHFEQGTSFIDRPGGAYRCVAHGGRCIGLVWVNDGRRSVSAGVLLTGIGTDHTDPVRSRTRAGPSTPRPVSKWRRLPECRRMSLLSTSSSCPGAEEATCRGNPSRPGPQYGGRRARSRQCVPTVHRPGSPDRQPAAEIPPLSPPFPASDLKSPLRRGHWSSCVRRPDSALLGPECRHVPNFAPS